MANEIVRAIRRDFDHGIPAVMLLAHAELIQAFVERYALVPLEETVEGKALGIGAPAAVERARVERRDPVDARLAHLEAFVLRAGRFPGGWPVEHLHFDDRVYRLTPEQWREFSGEMLGLYRRRLESVEVVTFPELASLSEAIDALPAH